MSFQHFFSTRLGPFRHPNYRAFYLAQLLSMIGKWSHDLARAFIVIELMNQASALGLLMLATAAPTLLLILHAGTLVDRIDIQKLVTVTKIFLALGSLGLAFVVEFGDVKMWHFLIFGMIEGAILAFDSPAFQALVVRLIPKEDLQQAIALNSTNFHLARTLGPLIAGLLMAKFGPSSVFLFDAITYLVLALILWRLKINAVERDLSLMPGNNWKATLQGLAYSFRSPAMRFPILQLILLCVILFPLVLVIFRTYLKAKFALDAEAFGFVFTLPATGAMAGALGFTAMMPAKPLRALKIDVPFTAIGLACVPMMPSALTSGLMMGVTSFFSYLSFASITVHVQLNVQEELRGRVSSLVGMCFLVIGPFAAYPLSSLADHMGYETAIYLYASMLFIGSAILAAAHFWRHTPTTKN